MKTLYEENMTALKIRDIVSEYSGIPVSDLINTCRKDEVVIHRHLAAYFITKHTTFSLKEVGTFFGNRSHATLSNVRKRMMGLLKSGDKKMVIPYVELHANIETKLQSA